MGCAVFLVLNDESWVMGCAFFLVLNDESWVMGHAIFFSFCILTLLVLFPVIVWVTTLCSYPVCFVFSTVVCFNYCN